ncbi:hypothetical protein [Sphingopyxis sp. 113P3]|uniref:hypothetical protein n=1 Tax=Sphingopyxis sp. (strain 113P3) TaxID=292913 RepID=UPI0006AD5D61|nr:hypothetical protein [Sphingopyxis sp. 113P3]ALC10741.1 hypothetical protein LH20_02125 [Sphingopyxis sp. 113P3]
MERRLLQRVNTFLDESAMPPSTFGRMAVRDPRFVSDLRRGRVPGRKTTVRVENFMSRWHADRRAGGAIDEIRKGVAQ